LGLLEMISINMEGLPVKWDPLSKKLYFGAGAYPAEPDIRRLEDMREVLYSPEEEAGGTELYFMYRDLHLPEHRRIFRNEGIRFDITVLLPGIIGREYVKTVGHYHPPKPGTPYTYPELYEVLYGKAHYLLQKPKNFDPAGAEEEELEEVIVVAAEAGDKVLIPSGYGHVTINPGEDYLIMSNLVADNFSSIYAPLRARRGAAYCQLSAPISGQSSFCFVPNPCYLKRPPLHFCRPVDFPPLPEKGLSQYLAFVKEPQTFRFLTYPEDFQEQFRQYLEALRQNPCG